jgi:hypothetical protein
MSNSQQFDEQIYQAADGLAERLVSTFWQRFESQVQSGLSQNQLPVPKELRLTPFEVDQRNFPRLNLTHHKLLNRNPSAYFGCEVKWPAPVQVDIPTFMAQIQHPRLAPFTQKLRVLADGSLYLKAVSGAWVHVFGAKLDWNRLDNPLCQTNKFRLSEAKEPQLIQFLEAIDQP